MKGLFFYLKKDLKLKFYSGYFDLIVNINKHNDSVKLHSNGFRRFLVNSFLKLNPQTDRRKTK